MSMISNETIRQEVGALQDYLIEKRRYFHVHPELSGTEVNTRRYIEQELDSMGVPYEEIPDTNLIAVLDTGKPGPTVLLRTDIDGLPIQEQENNLKGKRVVISGTPGLMHACGHDAHMAMALTSMKFLAAHRDQMIGKIILCCEEGEEDNRGIHTLWPALEERFGKNIDACWGIHVYAGLDSGKASIQPGAVMAGVESVGFTYVGKGGHGSRPDQAVNPVFCAANFYTNMAVAFANQIDANQTVTLGLTAILGGTVGNVIPDEARVLGSMRFFSVEEGEKAVRILHEVADHTGAMHHCRAVFDPQEAGMHLKPTINDPRLSALAEQKLSEVLPAGCLTTVQPWYASETFGGYLSRWPGVFMLLGIRNEAKGTGAGHHNASFDVDEDVLINGVLATVKYALSIQETYKD